MNTTILIFALWFGRATVLEYHGPINAPFDARLGKVISFAEAERRMHKANPPILFAPPAGAVVRVSKSDAWKLMETWKPYEGKKVGERMRKDFQETTLAISHRNFNRAGR